jgi:hypothetical protein
MGAMGLLHPKKTKIKLLLKKVFQYLFSKFLIHKVTSKLSTFLKAVIPLNAVPSSLKRLRPLYQHARFFNPDILGFPVENTFHLWKLLANGIEWFAKIVLTLFCCRERLVIERPNRVSDTILSNNKRFQPQ